MPSPACCDLMLFEGGLYFAIKNGDFPFCCDLMLFEGGLY